MVLWVFLQAMSAFFLSSSDVLTKKLLQGFDVRSIAISKYTITTIIMTVIALALTTPYFDKIVWLVLLVDGFLEALSAIIYMRAIQISDFSKTVPFMSFTPIGTAFVSYFINGEFPTLAGLLGIILVIAGSYTVNLNKLKDGLHAPIKEILANKGTLLILANVVVLSFAISLSRFAVKRANPLFSAAILLAFTTMFLFLFSFKQINAAKQQFSGNFRILLPAGLFSALSGLLSFYALSLTQAAYTNTVKRLNVLFSVLYGHFIFKEKDLLQHLVAVVLMLAGIAILAIYG